MEAVECGAAALAIVLAFYGRIVALEELRVAAGVSRDGSKANNMLKAARSYGFNASGYRKGIDALKKCTLPAIIFWNFNHFVVLEGFGKDKVYINDPAQGPRTVSLDEFDGSYTGVALLITPGPNFRPAGRFPSLLGLLAPRLRGSRVGLAFVLVASLLLTLVSVIVPSFTRIFVDVVLVGGVQGFAATLIGLMALLALMLAALAWLQQWALLRLEMKLAISSSGRFLWHILRLPIEFFQQRRAADISVRVGINDSVAQFLSGIIASNLLNILLIVCYIAVMIRYDLGLTVLGATIAGLNLLVLQVMSRRMRDGNQRLLNERGKCMAAALNGLQLIETLKATGSESDFFVRWSGYQANVHNAEQSSGRVREIMSAVPAALAMINVAAMVTVGSLAIIQGRLSVGELLAFQALMAAFLLPIGQLVSLGGRIQQTKADMVRLEDVQRYPRDPFARPDSLAQDAPATERLSGRIELDGVTFGYSKLDRALITEFSLTLRPGARVALVGGSGSGKSTVARLVAGIHTPWSGAIRFDGQIASSLPFAQVKRSLALVDQEIHLFSGTVRENLCMWNPTVPEAALLRAAKDAAIHDDIVTRPGGYDAAVQEAGSNFSGGQRQRLEIARALVGNPSILVMDEATSALDPVTEQLIDDNIRRRGCTCLIVAHRLSTIRDCDEIIVMDQGKVVQRGTHDQLIRDVRGAYARLIKADETMQGSARAVIDLLA
jgi:NHLM bacteriocin system ABC transporter peptidase/ATP-binding protein